MSPCGPGHYIGNEEGEMLQAMVDHALQAHSKAATPRKDCETCRLQGQYDFETEGARGDAGLLVEQPEAVQAIGLSVEGVTRHGRLRYAYTARH